ncbi:hypothetical protein IscW_ISCW015761 [Ixodes scapularis]|uniref:Uncharacterized protein n=1 Tax=Ixodes scapularis TaxID=6945 RepID=B7P3G3_IXOSC|nr:hypothetical protein IscW_ISCW015761 [Ixodes scapularis]|eukprot:XP_002404152.1 hypothetical protein IscW_ISCW015761 [Ixodes scapularis]
MIGKKSAHGTRNKGIYETWSSSGCKTGKGAGKNTRINTRNMIGKMGNTTSNRTGKSTIN